MVSSGNCRVYRLDLENRLLRATGNVSGYTEWVRNSQIFERAIGANDAIWVCFLEHVHGVDINDILNVIFIGNRETFDRFSDRAT